MQSAANQLQMWTRLPPPPNNQVIPFKLNSCCLSELCTCYQECLENFN